MRAMWLMTFQQLCMLAFVVDDCSAAILVCFVADDCSTALHAGFVVCACSAAKHACCG